MLNQQGLCKTFTGGNFLNQDLPDLRIFRIFPILSVLIILIIPVQTITLHKLYSTATARLVPHYVSTYNCATDIRVMYRWRRFSVRRPFADPYPSATEMTLWPP